MKKINNEIIRGLFKSVENNRKHNGKLVEVFQEYAKKTGYKADSLRNIYYSKLDEMLKNRDEAKNMGINLSKHNKLAFMRFTSEEADNLVKTIQKRIKQGESVRNVCLSLANNDVKTMIRYQNKYRTLQKQSTKKEIIKFPKESLVNERRLSDEDIKCLFSGLVKMVKRSAEEEITKEYSDRINNINNSLRKTLVVVTEKDKMIDNLKSKNKQLSYEVESLKNKLLEIRSLHLENINIIK